MIKVGWIDFSSKDREKAMAVNRSYERKWSS